MRRSAIFFVLGLLVLTTLTSAEIYLKETFSDDDWEKEDLGTFKVTAGEFYADEIESRGLQTSEDARFYAISTKLDKIIDNSDKDLEEASGTLEEDFDLLPPKEIIDASAKKPDDWDDVAEIPDPDDHKPADWVDHPPTIPDPDAKKPDDWDALTKCFFFYKDEMDGDWEPPHISNPEYKGEWQPKKIPNPKYKGVWKAPMIPNPDYVPEPQLHAYNSAFLGFDLWQVRSGTIFDNILITDDVETAESFANETFKDDDDIIDLDVNLGDDGEVKVTKPDDKEKETKVEKEGKAKDEKAKDEKPKDEKPKDEKAKDEKPKDEKPKDEKAKDEKPKDEKAKDEKPKDEKAKDEKPKDEKVKDAKEVKVKDDKEKPKDEKVKDEKDKVKVEKETKEEPKVKKNEKDEMDKLFDDFEEELGLPPKPPKKDHKLPIRDEF
ncbi:2088_t:CDS:2 [Racocetra fulgida]|uniref:2088_t:CDS:1 n=1 Tax=Racocetra fulgida TaxID=60492 RepID=A0A9N8ZP86_9GLOM|nr:2088_t:CDS:2 [Racocetra fulgida]